MNKTIILSITTIILLSMAITVHASNYYPMKGVDATLSHNVGGTFASYPYSTTGTLGTFTATAGQLQESVTYDVNNDGKNELFVMSSPTILSVYHLDEPDNPLDNINIGELAINPVLCPVENNGVQEYVGIFNNTPTNYTLYNLGVSNTTGLFILRHSMNVDSTKRTGNMVCGIIKNDGVYYVAWLGNDKELHIARDNNGWSITDYDVAGALASEAAPSFGTTKGNWSLGSHDLVFNDGGFMPNGDYSLSFMAGFSFKTLDTQTLDDYTYDLTSYYNYTTSNGGLGGLRLISGLTGSGTTKTTVYPASFSYSLGGSSTIVSWVTMKMVSGFFSTSLQIQSARTDFPQSNENYCMRTFTGGSGVLFAGTDVWDTGSTKEIFYIAKIATNFPTYNLCAGRLTPSNGTISQPTTVSNGNGCNPVTLGFTEGALLTSIGGFSKKSMFTNFGNCYGYVPRNSTQFFQFRNTFNLTTSLATPMIADVDGDGYLDVIMNSLTKTTYQLSNVPITPVTPTFSAATSVKLFAQNITTTITKINASYNLDTRTYDYGIVCDIGQNYIWNEVFNPQYSPNQSNSVYYKSRIDGQFYEPNYAGGLVYNGLRFDVNDSSYIFDFTKNYQNNTYSSMVNRVRYSLNTTATDMNMTLVMYDNSLSLASYFTIRHNAGTATIYKIVPGANSTTIGSYFYTQNNNQLEVFYTPASANGINYFTVSFFVNNQTIGTTTTQDYDTQQLAQEDLFVTSQSGIVITIHSISLGTSNNLQPPLYTFTNGQFTHIPIINSWNAEPSFPAKFSGSNFIITGGPVNGDAAATQLDAYPAFSKETFTGEVIGNSIYLDFLTPFNTANPVTYNTLSSIISTKYDSCGTSPSCMADMLTNEVTGGNTVFFVACNYPSPGVYTQRHYFENYANYKDLTVNITGLSTEPVVVPGQDGIPPSGSTSAQDAWTSIFPNVSTATALTYGFIFWMLLTIVLTIGAISIVGTIAGAGGASIFTGFVVFISLLIIGVWIGLVPIWVVIVLGILAAAVLAFTINRVMS